jgi:hypothetical protein
MAINQVSLFFYPPRWKQRLTPEPGTMTWAGKPVDIADAVPSGAEAPPIAADAIRGWLLGQGFTVADWGDGWILQRGRIQSMFGLEKEVQVILAEEGGELVEAYCRFTLPRRARPPLTEWSRFVSALCQGFQLRLANDDEVCGEAEFLSAVRDDRNYRDFADALGWDGEQAGPSER